MEDLQDRVVVITGAASGIGLAMASRFAREGALLVVADVEELALNDATHHLRRNGARVLPVVTDVSNIESVRSLLAKTLDEYGRVHVLCNNAGVQVAGNSWEIPLAQWRWILEVNLWGVIYGLHVFVPQFIAQREPAHIVNTASIAGLTSNAMMSAYQVTKHGIVTVSESLALELTQIEAPIGVSIVCPGYVPTNLQRASRNLPGSENDLPLDTHVTNTIARQVLTGARATSEVAEAVIEAILSNRLFVFTHPEMLSAVSARTAAIVGGTRPEPSRS